MLAIRAEQPGDAEAIDAVHRAAFGGELEALLVIRLRKEGELLISLVAEDKAEIIGHIALAPAAIAEDPEARLGWLAPLGVTPGRQRQGVGSKLTTAALDRARAAGLNGVIVFGDPAYYARFGFDARAAEALSSRFAGPYLQLLPFAAPPSAGALQEPRAFTIFD